jgi:hypothetical protein
MIELSLRREGNRATVLIACEKPRVLANATIVLVSNTGARPVETSYLTPLSFKATLPSPPNMACRWMIPTMGGDWNDTPAYRDTVRADSQLANLDVAGAPLGSRALNVYSGELFELKDIENMRGVWEPAGHLERTWKAPMLSEVPLPLCSIEYDSDPGELEFYDGPPISGYSTARNLFLLWNEWGRLWFRANWHEAVVEASFLPKTAFAMLRDAALQARLLLRGDPCEPQQHAQALSILDDALGDDDGMEPLDAPADS